jgi:hypothetical protein
MSSAIAHSIVNADDSNPAVNISCDKWQASFNLSFTNLTSCMEIFNNHLIIVQISTMQNLKLYQHA